MLSGQPCCSHLLLSWFNSDSSLARGRGWIGACSLGPPISAKQGCGFVDSHRLIWKLKSIKNRGAHHPTGLCSTVPCEPLLVAKILNKRYCLRAAVCWSGLCLCRVQLLTWVVHLYLACDTCWGLQHAIVVHPVGYQMESVSFSGTLAHNLWGLSQSESLNRSPEVGDETEALLSAYGASPLLMAEGFWDEEALSPFGLHPHNSDGGLGWSSLDRVLIPCTLMEWDG